MNLNYIPNQKNDHTAELSAEEIINLKIQKLHSSAVLLGIILVILSVAFAAITLYDSFVEWNYCKENCPELIEELIKEEKAELIVLPQEFMEKTTKMGEAAGFVGGLFLKLSMLSAVALLILALRVPGLVKAKKKLIYVGLFVVSVMGLPAIIGLFDPFRNLNNYIGAALFAAIQFAVVLAIDLLFEFIRTKSKNKRNYQ